MQKIPKLEIPQINKRLFNLLRGDLQEMIK